MEPSGFSLRICGSSERIQNMLVLYTSLTPNFVERNVYIDPKGLYMMVVHPLLVGPIQMVKVDWQSLPEFLAIFTNGPQLSALRTVV